MESKQSFDFEANSWPSSPIDKITEQTTFGLVVFRGRQYNMRVSAHIM